MKVCRKCGIGKPLSSYRLGTNGGGYRVASARCKDCEAEQARAVRRAHPHRHKQALYRSNLKRNWGLTVEDYARLLAGQGGGCAICGGHNSKGRLAVDHCHRTGKIRGLLCTNCNTGLGSFRDDPHLLGNSIRYLQERSDG